MSTRLPSPIDVRQSSTQDRAVLARTGLTEDQLDEVVENVGLVSTLVRFTTVEGDYHLGTPALHLSPTSMWLLSEPLSDGRSYFLFVEAAAGVWSEVSR